jgi:4-amino-4-deoxy-L-arabinose transferase-like glycosyltransferase
VKGGVLARRQSLARTLLRYVNAARPSGPTSRRFLVALLAIAAVALLIRVVYNVAVDPQVGRLSDASAYHLLGDNLADGRGYIRPFDFQLLGVKRATAEYPPLFPALLAALSTLGIGSVNAQQLVLAFIGTATVGLTGLVGRRVAGDVVGLVAAGIAAIHPMLFQADGVLMTESLATALVVGCVYLAVVARQQPSTRAFLLLGLALGAATLSRAEGLVFALVLVPPLAFTCRTWSIGRRAALAAIALGAMAIVVAPWAIYNQRRFHTFIPVSNNLGTVLDGANCDLTYSGTYIGSWRSEFGENRASDFGCFEGFAIDNPEFDEAVAASNARRDGLDYVRAHKRRLPAVALARLGRTWGVFNPDQQVNLGVLEGRSHRWETVGTWLHWLLLPLAAAGAVLLWRRRAVLWPLLAPIVTVSLVSIVTYGNQRFRISADPTLAVLAAASIVTAARMISATSAGARNLTAP